MQIDTRLLVTAGKTLTFFCHGQARVIAEKLAYNATRDDHKPENRRAEGGKRF